MKTFKYISFLLLITLIGTAIYIAVQPNDFSFSISRVINAPAPVLFNKVNDLRNWPAFSPWIEQEPHANLQFGDKTVGVNASYSWNGKKLGEGTMKTMAANNDQFISQHLSFIKPFEMESDIQWDFEPTETGTKVTWSMTGTQDFITKMYTVFSGSMERTMTPDFERGLFKLDSTVTADMKKYSITVHGSTDHSGGFYLYSTTSAKIDDVATTISSMLPKIVRYAQNNTIAMAGAPFVSYLTWDTSNNAAIFSVCVPTTDRVITTDSEIQTGELPPFRAVKTTLKGHYSNLTEAWETARAYVPKNGLELAEDGILLEVYITDRSKYPNPADWVTDLYIAVKQPTLTE